MEKVMSRISVILFIVAISIGSSLNISNSTFAAPIIEAKAQEIKEVKKSNNNILNLTR